jgi:uncharacterized protein YbbC (DUF1343 family)
MIGKSGNRSIAFPIIGIGIFFGFLLFTAEGSAQVKLGLENLLENHLDLIKGKSIGIIANHTSLDAQGRHLFHLLSGQARVAAVFGPEHGFTGNVEDGATISNTFMQNIKDGANHVPPFMIDIPLYSLYGEFRTPTANMLKQVDVLIYDIQDVGVKFYTYISNLFLAMSAAKREGIPILVLDRPNPISAAIVEGAITNPVYCSFVSAIPLPIRYGMTVGELAKLFNQESYAGFSLGADLTVIPMIGYKREMWYDETGLPWTPTSPNMPTLETAVIYPGTCLFEGVNLSEGRGTESPFLTVGAPFIDGEMWLEELPKDTLAGMKVEPTTFTPIKIAGKVNRPKFMDKKCQGLHIQITDRSQCRPLAFTIASLCAARTLYPKQFETNLYLDKLWGNEELRAMIIEGANYQDILKTTEEGIQRFKTVREKYLIYP